MYRSTLATLLILACGSIAHGQLSAQVSYNTSTCNGPPKQIVYLWDPACVPSDTCKDGPHWGGKIPMKTVCKVDGFKLTPQLFGKHPVASAIKFNSTDCKEGTFEWAAALLADDECILDFNGTASLRATIQPEKKQVTFLKYFDSPNCTGTPYTEISSFDNSGKCLGGWQLFAANAATVAHPFSFILFGAAFLVFMLL